MMNSSNRTVVPAATTCSFFSVSLWQRYVEVDEVIGWVEQRDLRRVARELLVVVALVKRRFVSGRGESKRNEFCIPPHQTEDYQTED